MQGIIQRVRVIHDNHRCHKLIFFKSNNNKIYLDIPQPCTSNDTHDHEDDDVDVATKNMVQ